MSRSLVVLGAIPLLALGAILLGLIVVGSVVGAGTAGDQPLEVGPQENSTVSVSASATASASPDLASVEMAVVETAEGADLARRRLADRVNATTDALRGAGVDDAQIRTTYFDVAPVRDENGTVVEYRAVRGIEVETAPPRAGAVVDVAVSGGASEVTAVAVTLNESTRHRLRERAVQNATERARADAEALADASDLSIAGVASVSTTNVSLVAPDGEDGPQTAGIDPGPVTVSATVSVTYRAD